MIASRLRNLSPSRREAIDAVFCAGLVILALSGLRGAFGGYSYLVTGVLATVLGLVAAHAICKLALPELFSVAVSVVVFFLFGAIALSDEALLGFIPTPQLFVGLIDGSVGGWKRLLTTLPPSGDLGNLLAVPYLCGYFGALITWLLANRTKFTIGVLLPIAGLLSLSVLFGDLQPFSLLVQGALLGAASLAWLAVRRSRERQTVLQAHGHRRLVEAVAMLALMGFAGFQFGPDLPLARANDRVVLRQQITPPFDVSQFASPLNGFTKYVTATAPGVNGSDPRVGLKDEVLFTVSGLPDPVEGADAVYLRLAVMDDYDGVVWRVTGDGSSGAGEFIGVGEEVPVEAQGEAVNLTITSEQLSGVWLPMPDIVSGVSWESDEQRRSFRLNTTTNTAILPTGMSAARPVRYTVSGYMTQSSLKNPDLEKALFDRQTGLTPLRIGNVAGFQSDAASIVKDKVPGYATVKALEEHFRNGYYSIGDNPAVEPLPPGHSLGRLDAFLDEEFAMVGSDEQYAASMALYARLMDMPVRVVMGFAVSPDGSGAPTPVTGGNVQAWVEVAFEGSWVRVDPTPRDRTELPQNPPKSTKPLFESQEIPPPPVPPPPPPIPKSEDPSERRQPDPPELPTEKSGSGWRGVVIAAAVVTVPLLAMIAPIVAILVLKRRRSRRRRAAEATHAQISGGWAELLDQARDVGLPVAAMATRREAAMMLGTPAAVALAGAADAAVFGGGQPPPEAVEYFWQQIDQARAELRSPLSLWGRLRAAISTTSLRSSS